jgi:hypothetical protein
VLGRGSPAAVRLENIARYLDFVAEEFARAAERAREILSTQPKETQDGGAGSG